MTTVGTHWLTRRGYEQIRSELDQLLLALRSAGGDAADPAARERRQWQDARIRQLQELLLTATVDARPPDDGVAEPGMVLTVRYGDGGLETFLLANREIGVLGSMEVYSPESPLGRALLGAEENETRTYALPNGETMAVTLISARPYSESVA